MADAPETRPSSRDLEIAARAWRSAGLGDRISGAANRLLHSVCGACYSLRPALHELMQPRTMRAANYEGSHVHGGDARRRD